MSEAASQLDLQILMDDDPSNRLIPASKKKSFFERRGYLFLLLLLITGTVSTLITWIRLDHAAWYYPPILIILLIVMFVRRDQVKGVYRIKDQYLSIPYTWFSRRRIPFDQIIRISDDKVSDPETGQTYAAIRIYLDTPLIKFNTTGMQPPNILLTTMEYDSMDLNRFADELVKINREVMATPNTLAQRLTDQVDRAWFNRWTLIFFNTIDATSEALFFVLLLDAIIYGFFDQTIWPIFGGLILGIIFLMLFIFHYVSKPQAIIGIRPHELGPLIYDEEELITSVRFIVMCRPYTVHLLDCEVIYPEGATKQVGRLNQIQPNYTEPGELTYAIAQIIGNHTKAIGAKINFSYKEKEESSDVIYEVTLDWS